MKPAQLAWQLALGLAPIAVLASCNALVGFDSLERVDDAGSSSSSSSGNGGDGDVPTILEGGDAPSEGFFEPGSPIPRCDRNKPFGQPQIIFEFDSVEPGVQSLHAIFSRDEHEAFFYTMRESFVLRHARRPHVDAPWTVAAENPSQKAGMPTSLTANGLRLYQAIGPKQDLVSARSSTNDSFTTSQPIDTTVTPQASTALYVVESDDKAYITVTQSGATDRFFATVPLSLLSTGPTPSAVIYDHVNNTIDDAPIVTTDEKAIYFYSNRPGGNVWVMRRDSKDNPFGTSERVTELDDGDTFISWVANDECEIVFNRNQRIQHARRPR